MAAPEWRCIVRHVLTISDDAATSGNIEVCGIQRGTTHDRRTAPHVSREACWIQIQSSVALTPGTGLSGRRRLKVRPTAEMTAGHRIRATPEGRTKRRLSMGWEYGARLLWDVNGGHPARLRYAPVRCPSDAGRRGLFRPIVFQTLQAVPRTVASPGGEGRSSLSRVQPSVSQSQRCLRNAFLGRKGHLRFGNPPLFHR